MEWSPFTHLFGNKPRIRALEALIDLAPYEFTVADFTSQADDDKNIPRQLPDLEREGFLVKTDSGENPLYRVDGENPWFQALDLVYFILHDLAREESAPQNFASYISTYWDAIKLAQEKKFAEIDSEKTSEQSDSKTDFISLGS